MKTDQKESMMKTEVEKNPKDLLVKNFVIQLGKRIQKVGIVKEKNYMIVTPKGWIEKQTWREINDILRFNGFAWLSSETGGCWIR